MKNIVSITVSENEVRAAELTVRRGTVTVLRLFSKAVPDSLMEGSRICHGEGFAGFLRDFFCEAEIKTKRVVFSAPFEGLILREIDLPSIRRRDIRRTIRLNGEAYFPVELSGYALSCSEAAAYEREGRKRLRLTAAVVPDSLVSPYYEAAEEAGMKGASVNFECGSLFRLLCPRAGDEFCLAVYHGGMHMTFEVFNREICVFQKYEELSGYPKHPRAEMLAAADRLCRMVEYGMRAKGKGALGKIFLLGEGGEELAELSGRLQEQLSLPVERIRSLDTVRWKNGSALSEEDISRYGVTIGAVMEPAPLVPEAMEERLEREREAGTSRKIILLALLISLAGVTAPILDYLDAAMDVMELKRRILLTEDAAGLMEYYEKAMLRGQDVETVRQLTDGTGGALLEFTEEAGELSEPVQITGFSFDDGEFTFSAVTESKEAAADIISALREFDSVAEVALQSMSSVYDDDGERVSFSVVCGLNGGIDEEAER